jgi:hypothetical protein
MHPPHAGADSKVQEMQSILVKFIDHETHDPISDFSNHSDAVALPQTSDEFLFTPGKLKTGFFD